MPKDVSKATMLPPSDMAFTLDPNRPVLTHGRDMQQKASITPHSHPRGQLLWAEKGILRVTGEHAVWVVPSTHAMWIPSGIYHQVSSETATQIRNIYIDPSYSVREAEQNIVMLTMSPLMQEVILRLTEYDSISPDERTKRLGLVAIDELNILESFNMCMHSGYDPRLQRLISHMVQHPNQTLSLPMLSHLAGASVRTIERLFKSETGMTFRQWRSRFRLMNSLNQLTQGEGSTFVAHTLGYKSVSSFIVAFKTQFGCTPQQYVDKH